MWRTENVCKNSWILGWKISTQHSRLPRRWDDETGNDFKAMKSLSLFIKFNHFLKFMFLILKRINMKQVFKCIVDDRWSILIGFHRLMKVFLYFFICLGFILKQTISIFFSCSRQIKNSTLPYDRTVATVCLVFHD